MQRLYCVTPRRLTVAPLHPFISTSSPLGFVHSSIRMYSLPSLSPLYQVGFQFRQIFPAITAEVATILTLLLVITTLLFCTVSH